LKPILVLCLGNEVLSDDAFGFYVAQELKELNNRDHETEVVFAALAGFNLLDLLRDRRNVLIVDAIITGRVKPGTIHFFPSGCLTPSHSLTCSHEINLPTALELGKQLGMKMPQDIDVLAVEVQDVQTLSEEMTVPVKDAVGTAVNKIEDWIRSKKQEVNSHDSGKRQNSLA